MAMHYASHTPKNKKVAIFVMAHKASCRSIFF